MFSPVTRKKQHWQKALLENLQENRLIKKILHVLWNPNFYFRVQNSTSLIPVLSHVKAFRTLHPSFLTSVLILYLSFHLRLGRLNSLPFKLHNQNSVRISHPLRATCPVHYVPLDFIILITFGEEHVL
jgi:hypothetical protein